MTKYNAKKTVLDGITFASKKEGKRYQELRLLERAGKIQYLELQKAYVLIPKQSGERACKYIADFVYMENGKQIVEDVKGYKGNPVWIIKRKLMLWVHGIKIREV